MLSIRDWDLIQRLGSSLYRSVTLSSSLLCSSCPFCVLYCTNFLQKHRQQPLISDTTTQSFLSTRSHQLSLSINSVSANSDLCLSLCVSVIFLSGGVSSLLLFLCFCYRERKVIYPPFLEDIT